MDDWTNKHLLEWLDSAYIDRDEAARMYFEIRAFVADYPDVLERGSSWPEIRFLVDAGVR